MSATDVGRSRAPGPGEAELPAPSVGALLRRNAEDPDRRDRPAVRFEELTWTWSEYVDECRRWASWLRSTRPEGRPFHVGVLLENTPAYLAALGGCALAGATLVGLNDTRRGAELARDVDHTDVAILVTQPEHAPLVEAILSDLHGIPVFTHVGMSAVRARPLSDPAPSPGRRGLRATGESHTRPDNPERVVGERLDPILAGQDPVDPGPEHDPDLSTTWCLVLTSGTTSAPKAVILSQRRMLQTGERMRMLLEVTPDDVGYIAMPLFHSNSLMVGWMPSVVAGASVGLARRFTASGWLADVRRYGATYFNYTGKPLSYIVATPEGPDDADNRVRRAFGNEGSPDVQERFSKRFGVEVIDLFGPTEGGVGITAEPDMPTGALGRAGDKIQVVDPDGNELPRAAFDGEGRLVNADEAVGEIVNTAGPGVFEGYYNNPEANARATRNGWYWTGDLGYVDDEGWLYFAGRTSDWLRVDGENFPAGPIEKIVSRHPDVVLCAVYGVPDPSAGDQVMAALVLADGTTFDPEGFAAWLGEQPDLGPKWVPRHVRVVTGELPRTATNKILTRVLQHQKFRSDRHDDPMWVRDRGAEAYRRFTAEDEEALHEAFVAEDRERFWDL